MLAAIRVGLERGCKEFHILGGTGKRFEHTFANLQCLSYLCNMDARGYVYGKNQIFTVIKNETFFIKKRENIYVSIFSITEESRGVTLSGFKYPLKDETIKKDFPIGISNELKESNGKICVKDGELLLVF
jgi:thiamine pyrophosphokinase